MNEALAHEQNPGLREPYGRLINPVYGLAIYQISTEGHSVLDMPRTYPRGDLRRQYGVLREDVSRRE
jgi:hypothetical protein